MRPAGNCGLSWHDSCSRQALLASRRWSTKVVACSRRMSGSVRGLGRDSAGLAFDVLDCLSCQLFYRNMALLDKPAVAPRQHGSWQTGTAGQASSGTRRCDCGDFFGCLEIECAVWLFFNGLCCEKSPCCQKICYCSTVRGRYVCTVINRYWRNRKASGVWQCIVRKGQLEVA